MLSLLFLFKGVVMGVLVCMTPGPILAIILKEGLKRGYHFAIKFGMGIAIIDILYCLLSFLGITPFLMNFPSLIPFMWLFAGISLIIFGIKDIFVSIKTHGDLKEPVEYKKMNFNNPFTQGVLISLLNPGALVFWIGVSSAFVNFLSIHSLAFVIGVSLGSPIWFYILAKIIAKLRVHLTEKFIYYFTFIGGLILFNIGIYFIVRSLTHLL